MNQDSASDVDSPWCDPSSIRALFSAPRQVAPVREASVPRQLRPAAVLVPLVARDGGITVLFTKRTDHLHHHPGQISFPGGRVEAHDESPVVAALRETTEEIGLDAGQVELLGRLPDYQTGTGFNITPVVGLVAPPFELRLDEFEVAEAFEVPLGFLMDRRNQRLHSIVMEGQRRQYFAIPYGRHYIWGATAGMLVTLRHFLRGEEDGALSED